MFYLCYDVDDLSCFLVIACLSSYTHSIEEMFFPVPLAKLPKICNLILADG